jgi:hypothetical protein
VSDTGLERIMVVSHWFPRICCPIFILWDLWWMAVRVLEARWGYGLFFLVNALVVATVMSWHESDHQRHEQWKRDHHV